MQVKSTHLGAAAIASLMALHMPSQAQTSTSQVTVGGRLTVGPRHVSHSSSSGSSDWRLGGTQDGSSFLYIKGSEDLGGGLKANFHLDTALTAETGAAGNFAGFWNREATVGLSGGFGQLRAGRQAGSSAAGGVLALADPLNGGATTLETIWIGQYTGLRFNRAVQWSNVFNQSFFLGGLYALGEQPTGASHGRTMALSAGYQVPGHLLRAALQQSTDGKGKDAVITSIGGFTTVLPSLTLHGALFRGSYEAGFAAAASSMPTGALFATGLGMGVPLSADMTAKGGIVGLTWRAAPKVTVKAAMHRVNTSGGSFLGALSPGNGQQTLVYLFGDYALSKRSSLQAGIDRNQWSGAWSGMFGSSLESGTGAVLNGFNDRVVLSLGLKHMF